METLQLLGIALGLGTLAGVNLYLTVFLTGLAVRFDFLQLATRFSELEILGHPAVLTVAFVLFLLEFFADKIPWVDSLWDSVHTVVRPAGAVLIALPALGTLDPAMEVIGALLAGIAAATTHSAKATTRLIVNGSPEPVSNVVVSVAEDVAVAGGVVLVAANPVVALGVFGGILVVLWMVMPRLLRVMKASAFLMWSKLRLPGGAGKAEGLPKKLSAEDDILLNTVLGTGKRSVVWAVPCVTGKVRRVSGLSSNIFGKLVALQGDADAEELVFLGRRWFRPFGCEIDCSSCEISHEPGFLSENLVIYNCASKRQAAFRFKRGQEDVVEALVAELGSLLARNTDAEGGMSVGSPEETPGEDAAGGSDRISLLPGMSGDGEPDGRDQFEPFPTAVDAGK